MKGPELKKLEELLTEAPSSVAECAALLDLPRRHVQIGIWQLMRLKRAYVVGWTTHPESGRGYHKQLKLYSTQPGDLLRKPVSTARADPR